MVEDLSGLTAAVLSPRLQDLIKKITYINENYYPLTLRRIHVINAPLVFNAVWAVVKNFFDIRVQQKIEILGNDQKQIENQLKQIIPPCFLLEYLGGTCVNKIPPGGSAKDLGKQIPMNPGQTRKVVIGTKSYYDHKIVCTNDTTIRWSFSSEHEIRFSIYKDENAKKREILKPEKKHSEKEKVEGNYQASV